MGIHRGPNTVNDNLVFGYDTGYGIADNDAATRFYPGKPTVNYLSDGIGGSNIVSDANWNGATPTFTLGTSEFGTPIGSYNTSGTSYMYSHDHVLDDDLSTLSGQNVTFSIYLKRQTAGNVRIRIYDNNSGYTYSTHSVTTEFQRYTINKTLGSSPTRIFVMIDNTGGGIIDFHSPQLEIGVATPFVDGTRSSTTSLIDLKRTTSIDVSNVSFDSTGQPTWDGTSDYITIPGSSGITSNAKTVEIMFKMNGSYPNYSPLAIYSNGSSATDRIWLGLQNNKFRMHGWGTVDPEGTTTIAADTWYVCVFSYDKTSQAMKVYANGVLETSTTNTQAGVTAQNTHNWSIGTVPGGWQSVTYSDADIPIFKVYNRILSDLEVKQNYNTYKNRFDI